MILGYINISVQKNIVLSLVSVSLHRLFEKTQYIKKEWLVSIANLQSKCVNYTWTWMLARTLTHEGRGDQVAGNDCQ